MQTIIHFNETQQFQFLWFKIPLLQMGYPSTSRTKLRMGHSSKGCSTKHVQNGFSGDVVDKQSLSCPVLLVRVTHIFYFDWAGIQNADENVKIMLQQMTKGMAVPTVLSCLLPGAVCRELCPARSGLLPQEDLLTSKWCLPFFLPFSSLDWLSWEPWVMSKV